ncbi:MAG: hypothetical protein EOS20_18600 [Mesorhizobium sp.]|uniref:hypothetical protein n=1 Tax=Mesorhizobium sp. TaxID=1871066 RepID=UPI000FE7DCE5|nr:hypothetical protein [Mesorhizobium sp.]RWQ35516.1 MAG: hypothetical protein EOS20_18600 [Mesorhizobium sp.]RWQ38715.1 MAG: hypothetical protein EOS21_19455 [Mesorhizobium sp.]
MNKTLADFLQRQKSGLKAEATALLAIADKDTAGVLTTEQDARVKAIEADCALIDAQIVTANAEAETPEAMAARLRAEMAEVTAACAIAGKPARASAFITAGTPLNQVVSTLHAEAAAAGNEINTHNNGGRSDEPAAKPIPSASEIYAKRAKAQADRLRK